MWVVCFRCFFSVSHNTSLIVNSWKWKGGAFYICSTSTNVERFQIEDLWEFGVPVSHSPMSDT